MSRFTVMALAGVIATTAPVSSGAQSPSLKAVMQEKAENAQGLLKPIVLGDFAGIERSVNRLARLTFTEVASWQGQPNSEYQQQAIAFLQGIEALGRAAESRDVKRASTAYGNLVSSCVNCHQLVKVGRSVSLTPPAPVLNLMLQALARRPFPAPRRTQGSGPNQGRTPRPPGQSLSSPALAGLP